MAGQCVDGGVRGGGGDGTCRFRFMQDSCQLWGDMKDHLMTIVDIHG